MTQRDQIGAAFRALNPGHSSNRQHVTLETDLKGKGVEFDGPIVELHISNPHLREPFRHLSYVAATADALIAGFGTAGYRAAITAAAALEH